MVALVDLAMALLYKLAVRTEDFKRLVLVELFLLALVITEAMAVMGMPLIQQI
jgi:hypothetical protein